MIEQLGSELQYENSFIDENPSFLESANNTGSTYYWAQKRTYDRIKYNNISEAKSFLSNIQSIAGPSRTRSVMNKSVSKK